MARLVDTLRRVITRTGTASDHDVYVGPEGELVYLPDADELYAHDGATPGGNLIGSLVAGSTALDISVSLAGLPADDQLLVKYVFVRGCTLVAGLTGSQGHAATAATAQTDFDVQKNAVSVGTITFAMSATTATFVMAVEQTFVAGDRLHIIAPATADITLDDISITLKGTRTS